MERRLAAIVCADVAGYSRMMGTDEAGTHATFKAHRTAIYPIILNHGGRLVKNTGDGFLLEFPSIVGAIQAANEMQSLMLERNNHIPADRVMQFRMGIHMGDVIADEDEVFGDDVNIAVRLESVAAPGGIAVSGKAQGEAGKHIGITFADAGSHRSMVAGGKAIGQKGQVPYFFHRLVFIWKFKQVKISIGHHHILCLAPYPTPHIYISICSAWPGWINTKANARFTFFTIATSAAGNVKRH